MLYYQVKPESDNLCISAKSDILIGRELYTPREYEYKLLQYANTCGVIAYTADDVPQTIANLFRRHFNMVRISRKKIYWSFGARFADDENIQEVTYDK